MWSRLLVILPAGLLLWSASALAENRIALVVGNSAYKSVTILPNPANDAKAVADMLRSAQFEVIEEPDLSQTALRRVIHEFANKAAQKGPDTISLVYYAGHGIQVDGENYLVPIDADIQRESDVPIEAVRLNDLMTALGSTPSKTRIVILDACRNNPFSEINKITGRGLAIVDAPNGSMVSYSTSPGMQAADGQGANSPFTTALIEVAREPNVPIEQAFKRIRVAVHKTTDGLQTPWESSSLTSDFSFFGPAADGQKDGQKDGSKDAQKTAAPAGVFKTADVWRKELAPKSESDAFEIVIRADDVEAYQAFLTVFPSASVASRVRGLLDRRREMTTWYMAVLINTPLSYQGFLDRYPNSDLAPTAQRLRDRAQLRAQSAMARATPPGGPNSPGNPIATPISLPVVPTCSCSPANPTKDTKEKSKPSKPTRPAGSREPVVVVQEPPRVSIGVGIGGLGGIGRGRDYGPPTRGTTVPPSMGRRQY